MNKPIKIAVDLDGVIAQHSLGGFWVWTRKAKEKILKKAHSSSYYYPSTVLEKTAWLIINGARRPFPDKNNFFASLVDGGGIQFYLVTSRFKFLEELTRNWLKKYNLDKNFHKILINSQDADPSLFKERAIRELELDYFIDDDLEVINYLEKKTKAKLYWVVPGHRKKTDNHNGGVITCDDFLDALRKIVSTSENSS